MSKYELRHFSHGADKSSPYRGVHFYERTGRWQAVIRVNSKLEHLGYYDTADEAAHAYDMRALALFGEFAILNDPAWVRAATTAARNLAIAWNVDLPPAEAFRIPE